MAEIRPNPTLSDDLISEILVRVPVKSLVCFKSVCKTWLSLINNPVFVKSQLRHAETHQTLILTRRLYAAKRFVLHNVHSCEFVADLKLPGGFDDDVPYVENKFRMIGSANGIVCIALKTEREEAASFIYLWNPATRQSKCIPLCGSNVVFIEAFSFGYDPIDDDFKVVRVFLSQLSSPSSFCVEVYSSNMNVWRKVQTDPIGILWTGDFEVCVNGFLCGIRCVDEFLRGMISFDLNKEVLNCGVKLPLIISTVDEARIIEVNNSVAVIKLKHGFNVDMTVQRLDQKIYVWTLDDDACLRGGGGVEASWTLMFSIDLSLPAQLILGYFSNVVLLLIENGDHVWISCNTDKKETEILPLSVNIDDYRYSRNVFVYTESLVSLPGFKEINWNSA